MSSLEKPGGLMVTGLVFVVGLMLCTGCERSENLLGQDAVEDTARQVQEGQAYPPNWIGLDRVESSSGGTGTGSDSSGVSYQVDERDFFLDPDED